MTDINNSPSGRRLPLLVGDVVRMGDQTFMLTVGSGNLVGTALNGKMLYWTRNDGMPYAPVTKNVRPINEILGGALR